MGSNPVDGTLSEDEVRSLISLQIVIDSARDAGLEVGSPIHAESNDGLLVYGGEATMESPFRGRKVRVRAFNGGLETVALAGTVSRGEVLALVEWGGLSEGDAEFLLAASDVEDVRSGQRTLRDCVATLERWRALVLG